VSYKKYLQLPQVRYTEHQKERESKYMTDGCLLLANTALILVIRSQLMMPLHEAAVMDAAHHQSPGTFPNTAALCHFLSPAKACVCRCPAISTNEASACLVRGAQATQLWPLAHHNS